MALYDRFNDESEFRDKFVKPLLNRLGYFGVSEQHGSQEFGKDFVFSELHRLGGLRHYAAQVKHEKGINQGSVVDALLSQVRQAFAKPFKRPDSPRDCHVSAVYVFNSGKITDNAKEQFLSELGRERYGDNVHFLDSERLEALNEWTILQRDGNARAKLLGLRASLRFIVTSLVKYGTEGTPDFQPMYTQGVELFISEPVEASEDLFQRLFLLWQLLQTLEAVRVILIKYPKDSAGWKKNAPTVKNAAQAVTKQCDVVCAVLDSLLEKMKPLGGI